MNKFLIGGIIALCIITAWYYTHYPLSEKVIIRGHTIHVEVAVTEAEKEKGLGYRDFLPVNTGMLFVYDHPERYGFGMKGMRFPLDFIWIDGNTIVDLSDDIPAPANDTDQPVSLSPRVPVDKVLEVNAGMIQSLDIHIGDTVRFTN